MKIKSLLVIPGKEVQIVKIVPNIKFIKAFIGKNLQKIKLNENAMIIANENAPNDEFNRFYNGEIIFGTFIIVGMKNGRRVSLKKRELKRYFNMFKISKHDNKINRYKEEFLEEYYFNQRKLKKENEMRNKETIFKIVA